jgi:light-regulated signal transduction histidine kinase (bacteriophytochrome)
MIVGLLAFSRASAQPFEHDFVNMTALARSAAEEVIQQRAGSDPLISITDLPVIYADHTAMREVWLKLIDNALKFSAARGQARITISGHVEGAAALFQIEDDGAGFDMRHVDRIFGMFERLHRGDEFDGLGTGLAIAKRLIVRHGGEIRARGTPDQGACFEFHIPNESFRACQNLPGASV